MHDVRFWIRSLASGSTINHLRGEMQIFANNFFFDDPQERFFFAKLTEEFFITWFYRENVKKNIIDLT